MADVGNVYSVAAVELAFEREDHDHFADVSLDLLHASWAPGPNLRADEIENRNSKPVELARQAQIEVREVDQDGSVGPAPCRLFDQAMELLSNMRQVRDHLDQPDHCHFFGVDQQLAAGGAHFFSAHAEEPGSRRKLRKRVDELRAVGVA